MYYYLIGVSSRQFYATDELTYASETSLKIGQVIEVELKNKLAIGIILAKTAEPSFKTKPISRVFEGLLLPKASLKLLDWLRGYYPASLGLIINQFLPPNLSIKSRESSIEVTKPQKKIKLPAFTKEQATVLKEINKSSPKTFLLHGETGSGKTRVYQELAAQELSKGNSSIILTPEISLTTQLVKTFKDSFGDQVVLTHSNLTPTERKKIWLKCLTSNEPLIIIGPRSALFIPVNDIGLIVVDEFHEPAYKQESHPKYQTARVASTLGQITGSIVVFGSATPPITDYYLAEQKNVPILRMKERAVNRADTKVEIEIVDLKNIQNMSPQPFISKVLSKSISKTLAANEQSILFLNRRGHTRLVFCKVCSWQALCPNCNIPLTYHLAEHTFRCHLCDFSQRALSACPDCKNTDISFSSIGTQGLSVAVKKLFPNARSQRFDGDNTKEEQVAANYPAIASGEIEILIGTQILAKGLDLPNLGLVSVILADSSLQFPDYTASERTYQLISQLLGRVGRGHRLGRAVIQTYSPDSPVLKHAIASNWQDFYKEQLAERQLFGYPPFFHLLKLEVKQKNQSKAESAAHKLANELMALKLKIEVVGPSPSFIQKQRGFFHWQIIIKSKVRSSLVDIVKNLPPNWTYDLDPIDLL